MSERAERRHQLRELEQAMLRDLRPTEPARASRFAVWIITAMDGLSPLLSGSIVLIPSMLAGSLFTVQQAYIASPVVALALLFGLGMFLAKVGSDHILPSGIRMVGAGLVCVVMPFLLSSGASR